MARRALPTFLLVLLLGAAFIRAIDRAFNLGPVVGSIAFPALPLFAALAAVATLLRRPPWLQEVIPSVRHERCAASPRRGSSDASRRPRSARQPRQASAPQGLGSPHLVFTVASLLAAPC